ncbi:hypothetical protein GYMLUDRAFT_49944 [Collybiopsis luxurians FD-317 M1]|uniref:Uncharacterized protein n=1 Tax=Collybiopsis luxurians FD-317 M1 TaxID=944289 RepID=A0A0D0CC25_9AGAR|nr:hypothetical protein GYMLUDRAFT_49944 [Collybiopsis luxurians FD-317 M1]
MGLTADNWIWSGFFDPGPKAPSYPGLQLYKEKPVVEARIWNVPKGKFPTTGNLNMKALTLMVDPRDPKNVFITDGEKEL